MGEKKNKTKQNKNISTEIIVLSINCNSICYGIKTIDSD